MTTRTATLALVTATVPFVLVAQHEARDAVLASLLTWRDVLRAQTGPLTEAEQVAARNTLGVLLAWIPTANPMELPL